MIGKSVQKVIGKSVHPKRYGRAAYTVLCDMDLSASSRCIYAYLACWVFQGRTASIGQRKIGRDLGFHQETVIRGLRELAERKHITVEGAGKARRTYILLSGVFAQKQGKEDIIVSGPRGRRLVSVDLERTA